MDYIANGVSGSPLQILLNNGMDPRGLRPYRNSRNNHPTEDPRTYIDRLNTNGKLESVPVQNTNATLLKDEWKLLDQVVVKAALPRLSAVADLRGRGMELIIPNGMSKTKLETQAQSDINQATISMSPLADSAGDRPVYNLVGLPLPIIHKDFSFDAREIAGSRNGTSSTQLDLTTAELAARRVAEGVEQLLLGTAGGYQWGGGSIYGFTNFPNRMTYALTNPTTGGWTSSVLLAQVLAMRQLSYTHLHYGPYVLYVSTLWDSYLDNDYILTGGNVATQTLRERLKAIKNIDDVVTADYLNGYDMVLVQQTSDVARMVTGMDITTVQWETHGGMQLNFKVMCILIPQLRSDFNGNTGIVHGSVSGVTTPPLNEQFVIPYNP